MNTTTETTLDLLFPAVIFVMLFCRVEPAHTRPKSKKPEPTYKNCYKTSFAAKAWETLVSSTHIGAA